MGKQKEEEEKKDRTALLLQERKKIIYNLVLVVTASFVVLIGILTMAWFSMNKNNTTSGMGTKVGTNDFEIRVSGDNIGAKSYTKSVTGDSVSYSGTDILNFSSIFGKYKNGAEGTSYDTDGASPEIKWRMTPEHDTEKGLGPGSQGTLTFSIIPKRTGTLNPEFSLRLDGYIAPNQHRNENGSYQVADTDLEKITSDSDEAQLTGLAYLKGHILFFSHRDGAGTDESPYTYTGLLDENDFSLSDIKGTEQSATIGTPIEVTIYWVWPNTFGQMVLSKSENNNKTPIVTDIDTENSENPENAARIQTKRDVQNYVLDNITAIFDLSKMTFAQGIESEEQKINAVKLMMATSSGEGEEVVYAFNSSRVTLAGNASNFSRGYNNADQSIGTNVNYVLIALEVLK